MSKLIDASNFFDEYCYMFKNSASEAELDRLSYMLGKEKQIDPVHFAEGCYCKECKYYKPYEFPESGNIIYQCYNSSASYLEEHKPNDFCSKGKKGNPKNA